jgi:uncharacterized phosphosugar-binding protein
VNSRGAALCEDYLASVTGIMRRILDEEEESLQAAAALVADQVAADRLVHIYGPGGHSNLGAQEIFFRAGGLMHVSAILDEGTLLSNGALRSMAVERLPGYGRVVIGGQNLGPDDLLVLVNAYGINAALIDAALLARELGVTTIGVSSRDHARDTALDHPARHPSGLNLGDLVNVLIDCKVPIGDAVVSVPGVAEKTGAVSTFANAFALNSMVIRAIALLAERGIDPPMWRSGNAPGGDETNARFRDRFRSQVPWL